MTRLTKTIKQEWQDRQYDYKVSLQYIERQDWLRLLQERQDWQYDYHTGMTLQQVIKYKATVSLVSPPPLSMTTIWQQAFRY